MTVAALRELLAGLPDDAPVLVEAPGADPFFAHDALAELARAAREGHAPVPHWAVVSHSTLAACRARPDARPVLVLRCDDRDLAPPGDGEGG